MKIRACFIVFLLLSWLAFSLIGCAASQGPPTAGSASSASSSKPTTSQEPPSAESTRDASGTQPTTSQEQTSEPTTTQPIKMSVEESYATTTALVDATFQKLSEYDLSGPDPEQALDQIVAWLSAEKHITSAGFSKDDHTIWMNFDYGVNAVVLTQLRGEPVPADYAAQYDAYKASLSENRIRTLSHFRTLSHSEGAAGSDHSAVLLSDEISLPEFDPADMIVPGQPTPGGVGCSAWIFAPFQWESLTDPNKILEVDTIRQHYAMASLAGSIPIEFDLANVFYNENATVDALGAALSGRTGPAIILEINTHGGSDTRNGQDIIVLLSGEEMTAEKYLQWFEELQTGLLSYANVGGKSFLAITPEFIKTYSGLPQPDENHWLARYIHVNACNSYHPSLIDAFLENGTVVYSGYDNLVGWEFGAKSTIEFFENLSKLMDVQQAWENVSAKTDPDAPHCDFAITGNVNTRYFYRAFFDLDAVAMETPAYGWLVAYDAEDGGPGIYWSLTAQESSTKFPMGKLTLQINADHTGSYDAAADERVSIHFDDFATRWSCSLEQANAGKPCSGTIEINEISDMHGGPVTGTFTAQLVDSHQTDPPYEIKAITGNFIVLRSKSQG